MRGVKLTSMHTNIRQERIGMCGGDDTSFEEEIDCLMARL
jgi:hypothetical protein